MAYRYLSLFLLFFALSGNGRAAEQPPLCLDSFCIGQSITEAHFDGVAWELPQKGLTKIACTGVGCRPAIAFRGYPTDEQARLSEAVSWAFGLPPYTPLSRENLALLRHYRYECDLSQRGIFGERRFMGAYRSIPSNLLTVVGLRLIDGELKVYRVARQYPIHNAGELATLAKTLHGEYGDRLLYVDYLSSNAYTDVITQKKDGWFGRSSMFNPNDLSDNAAELVLIDPQTRPLLEPSSMPVSGEIKPLPVSVAPQCQAKVPTQ